MRTDIPARDLALRVLSRRDYSAQELLNKLSELDCSDEDAEDALSWLIELGYVDDEKYAKGLMARCVAKSFGLSRCRQDMRRRGIDTDTAERVLDEYPDSTEVIDNLIRRSAKYGEVDFKERQRLTGLLLRRGFEYDEIRDGLSRFELEDED